METWFPSARYLKVQNILGPTTILRYKLYPAATITGQTAPGASSGQALDLMEQMAREKLPAGISYDWTAVSYQEKLVGNQAIYVFALAVLLVYLVLAAQYESWIRPAAVILVVPLALLGTVAAVALRGMDNNVYTQIGIVLIIALASKNAILIVEFARDLRAEGHGILEAAAEAAQKRFRPILMTSVAFILGVFPLVIAEGAGAASRQALGTAVFGGMIAATFLTIFFVPVFFVLCQKLSEWWSSARWRQPRSRKSEKREARSGICENSATGTNFVTMPIASALESPLRPPRCRRSSAPALWSQSRLRCPGRVRSICWPTISSLPLRRGLFCREGDSRRPSTCCSPGRTRLQFPLWQAPR